MGELHPGCPALAVDEVDEAGMRRDLVVVPQAEVTRRDPAPGLHRRRLGDDQTEPAGRQGTEVGEVPVGGHTVGGVHRVLAHRCDEGAVAHFQSVTVGRGQGDGSEEEMAHTVVQRTGTRPDSRPILEA